jgi:DNA-binding PadR family transcriptional regulator
MIIAEFERHSGLIRILLILKMEGRVYFQDFIDKYGLYSTSFYRAVKKAQQMGLIDIEMDMTKRRTRKYAELTDLGILVSGYLWKIENELRSSSNRSENGA